MSCFIVYIFYFFLVALIKWDAVCLWAEAHQVRESANWNERAMSGGKRGVAGELEKREYSIQGRGGGLPAGASAGSSSEKQPLLYSTISKYGQGEAEESQEMTEGKSTPLPEIKVYKWRWVVLGLFSLNNVSLNYVWIMAAPVANLITCYYRTSDTMVNLLSTSYMITYTLMALPVSWAMDRYGLKVCAVLASAASALGASIKVFGSGKS